jgi:GT2 family glycosyltransferase
VVCYNTEEIISRAVNLVREHVDKVVIVDNSDVNHPAYEECDGLGEYDNVEVVHTYANVGHGPGLNIGIEKLNTEYIVCMDSDAYVLDSGVLKDMREALEEDNVYGCGLVVTTDNKGFNRDYGIDYLHPYFCMMKRTTFDKHHPFINHGAPFIRTMNEINGKMKVVNIPNIDKRVFHEHRRTVQVAGKDWLRNWENPLC